MNLGFAPTKENRAVHWRYSYAVLIFIAGFDMKRWSFVLLLAGSMPAAGALGFWFGVREGLQLGVWADAGIGRLAFGAPRCSRAALPHTLRTGKLPPQHGVRI